MGSHGSLRDPSLKFGEPCPKGNYLVYFPKDSWLLHPSEGAEGSEGSEGY